MPADRGGAVLVPQVVLFGMFRAESHQIVVALESVEDDIVAPGKALRDERLPDATFDAAPSRTALAVLKTEFVEWKVVHLGIDVCDPVQQHARLVGVAPVVREGIGIRQRGNASLDPAPHRLEIVVCDNVVPVSLVVEHAISVFYIEFVHRIGRIGMICIEKQRPVPQLAPEHPLRVEGRPVEGPEVVLRIDLPAVFAPDLPRPGVVEFPPFAPRFRRRLLPAAGTVGLLALVCHAFVGVDCPR